MSTVMIVEDDVDLRGELADYLQTSGYSVTAVGSIAEAELALLQAFDLLVLDINLPDGNGLELCRRLRPYIRSGIVMCTGRSDRDLRIASLRDGADAYLVKPVDPEELEANLISVLRRASSARGSLLAPPPLPVQWRVDRTRQTLAGPRGGVANLSQIECLLLVCVAQAPNRMVTRAVLLDVFAQAGWLTDGRRTEAMISRLRLKVQEKMTAQLPLAPVYGKGYVFADHIELI